MSKKFFLPILAGLVAGQIFAASDRPFSIINTLKVGHTDNLYRTDGDEESTFYASDVVDLAYRAAFSARTDLTAKSRFELMNDSDGVNFYPNLYLLLNHALSPRFQLSLTEYLRSGDQSGRGTRNNDQRDNYYYNKVGIGLDYIMNQKNTLESSASYAIKRYDNSNAEVNDSTETAVGLAWSHEILPQRTYSKVSVNHRWIDYPNKPEDSLGVTYDENESSTEVTDLSAGFSHTFNPQWSGHAYAGASYIQPDNPDYTVFGTPVKADNETSWSPLVNVGLVYAPSPQTRLSADLTHTYSESDSVSYSGQKTTSFSFGIQHDITAKIMAKATARFVDSDYDGNDAVTSGAQGQDDSEERMDLQLKFSYKINRINFLELSLKHTERDRDRGADWEENDVYLGWRVEIE